MSSEQNLNFEALFLGVYLNTLARSFQELPLRSTRIIRTTWRNLKARSWRKTEAGRTARSRLLIESDWKTITAVTVKVAISRRGKNCRMNRIRPLKP